MYQGRSVPRGVVPLQVLLRHPVQHPVVMPAPALLDLHRRATLALPPHTPHLRHQTRPTSVESTQGFFSRKGSLFFSFVFQEGKVGGTDTATQDLSDMANVI